MPTVIDYADAYDTTGKTWKKHTPGPWQYEQGERESDYRVHADGASVAPLICAGTKELAKANARLIAAAPDLYEALAKAEYFLLNRAHLPNGPDFADTLRDVSAALTKVSA